MSSYHIIGLDHANRLPGLYASKKSVLFGQHFDACRRHKTEFCNRWHSLAEGIVSGKITVAENHEQEKGHRRGQIRGELD